MAVTSNDDNNIAYSEQFEARSEIRHQSEVGYLCLQLKSKFFQAINLKYLIETLKLDS